MQKAPAAEQRQAMQPVIVVTPLVVIMTMKVMISTMAAAWTAFRPSLPSLHAAQHSLLQAMLMQTTVTATMTIVITTTALREAASALATHCVQTRPTVWVHDAAVLALLAAAAAAVVALSWAGSSAVALLSGLPELLLGLQRKTSQLRQRQSWSLELAGVATAVMTMMTLTMMQKRQASLSGLLRCRCLGLVLLSGQASLRHLLPLQLR